MTAMAGHGEAMTVGPDAAQTVVRFYRHLDDREYAALAALLAPDGVWHRQGAELRGADVVAALSKRSPTMRIHHLLTNVFAVPDGPDAADVTAYMLVVRHEPGAPLDGPAPFAGIETIRTVRARLRATPDGWRIERATSDPISFAMQP